MKERKEKVIENIKLYRIRIHNHNNYINIKKLNFYYLIYKYLDRNIKNLNEKLIGFLNIESQDQKKKNEVHYMVD